MYIYIQYTCTQRIQSMSDRFKQAHPSHSSSLNPVVQTIAARGFLFRNVNNLLKLKQLDKIMIIIIYQVI